MHLAFRAVGQIAERNRKTAQRSWGRDIKIAGWHDRVKRGHRSRGLWPKTPQRMTPMRHFVCLGICTWLAKLDSVAAKALNDVPE